MFHNTLTLLMKAQITSEIAMAYLHAVSNILTHPLETDWISYGIILGRQGELINPLTPLEEIGVEEVQFDDTQLKSSRESLY